MINKVLWSAAFFGLISIANAQSGPSGPWQLTFSDEFNGTSLDTTKWKTQYTWGCTNNPGSELECYQPDDVAVSGGQLHLKAEQRTVVNGGTTFNYTSGMVQSAAAFSQTYGYFEARFKIPTNPPAVGFWPAFWAMPADGSWPPEIDVIELGNSNDTTAACMHVDTSGGWLGSCWSNGTNWSQDYHVWAVYWEPGTMTWYIDGIARQTINDSTIPSKAFYLIANLAVGGYGASPGSTTPFPSYMDVDYIRAWTKGTGSCSTCYATIPGPTDPIPTVTGVSSTDTQAPTVPTNLTATVVSSSQITVSWTASTDNVGVAGYKVFRGATQVGTVTSGTTYQDTGLTPSTAYTYTVSAYDAAGNNSAQTSAVSATTAAATDTQAPTVPTNLTATAVSSSQINLSWTASTDNVGVTGYKVFRAGAQIGTTAGTTYQNTGLTASTSYSYTVSAYDAAGNNSAQTSAVSATTQAVTVTDTQPPTVPTGLMATAVSSSQINLSWTASTDNVGVTGYKVFRGGTQLATITSGTSYQDTGLTASTTYSYTVSAYDAAGNNSAQTSAVSATTQAAGPSPTSPPPTIFFTDLNSGPKTGGEGGNGAYVTLYGNNFATSQGSSVATVGGGAMVNCKIWGATWLLYQTITCQLGPNASTGNIVVTVNGQTSNGVPFTVRSGNIYFVSTSGSDSAAGSFTAPFATVTKCKSTMAAGDICYLENGVSQTAVDNYNADLSIQTGGTASAPLALVAYPGAVATVGNTSATYGMRTPAISGSKDYWVIAGLTLRGLDGLDLVNVTGWRVVGNDFSCPNGYGQSACFHTDTTTNLQFYGNYVHNVGDSAGSIDKYFHAVYFTTNSNHIDAGWNTIVPNPNSSTTSGGCRAMQFYSTGGANQFDLHVHDNVIHHAICDGINFSTVDPSQGTVEAYNNVVYHVGTGPDPYNSASNYSCVVSGGGGSGSVQVYNNTFYDCGSRKTSDAGALDPTGPGIVARNNIIYQLSGESYLNPNATASLLSGSNNLWFGLSAAPSQTTGNIASDALFVSTGSNFQLQAGSPAVDAGVTISGLLYDIIGTSRPQGSAYDIGAYEYFKGSGTVQMTCDLNGDGVVNSLDVQIAINQALGLSPCGSSNLMQNGTCNIIDVQRVINASMGQACRVGS